MCVVAFAAALIAPIPARAQTAASPIPAPSALPSPAAGPTSPAPEPSPGDALYAFVPPQGWQPVSPASMPIAVNGIVALWMSPAVDPKGFRPNINITRENAATTAMTFETITAFERASIERIAGAGNVKERFAGACAPGVKNESYVSHLTLGAFVLHVEQIVSVGKAATYIATYEYLEGSPPDIAAEAAVNAFCSSAIPIS